MNRAMPLILLLGLIFPAAFGMNCKDKVGNSVPIRVASRAQYRSIQDGKDWLNPYVVVSQQGFDIRVPGSKVSLRDLNFEQVMSILESQSCEAWPFGAVVWVSEQLGPGRRSKIYDPDFDNRSFKLRDALVRSGIKLEMIPTA